MGVYQEGCGLRNVYMSWGAAEYLYMLLVLNQTALPEEALFMIRWEGRPRGHGRCRGRVVWSRCHARMCPGRERALRTCGLVAG